MMHKHYLFPLEYAVEFSRMEGTNVKGIEVEDFAIGVDMTDLKTFPNFDSFEAAWLGSWKPFFDENQGKTISQKQAFDYCTKLAGLFGLES